MFVSSLFDRLNGTLNTRIIILQDATDQTGLDNFMVHELDGTQNEWGWCKQKVFMLMHKYQVHSSIIRSSLFISLTVFGFSSAWCKCHPSCITCCV